MEKNILFFLIFIFLFSGCKTSTNSINAPKTEGELLLSKIIVDGELSKEFIYNDESKLIQMNQYFKDSIISTQKYSYNSNGQLSEIIHDGFTDTFKYNDNGLLESRSSYYEKTDKSWQEVYSYAPSNFIQKALTYYNNEKRGYIQYSYDTQNNTIERREYEDKTDFLLTEYRIKYDNYENPFPINIPIDLRNNHNIKKYYYYSAVMSSPPNEYESKYEYNSEGLPIKEIRQYLNGNKSIYIYEYLSK